MTRRSKSLVHVYHHLHARKRSIQHHWSKFPQLWDTDGILLSTETWYNLFSLRDKNDFARCARIQTWQNLSGVAKQVCSTRYWISRPGKENTRPSTGEGVVCLATENRAATDDHLHYSHLNQGPSISVILASEKRCNNIFLRPRLSSFWNII